jgi:drug/metabolite transporter (DMT)-like permease
VNYYYFSLLLLLAAIWGSSFLFLRIATPVLGPVWLIEFRVLIAGLVLVPAIIWRKEIFHVRQNVGKMIIAGFFNAALPFCLLAYATLKLTAGITSILNATVPIFGAIFGYFVVKEQLGLGKSLGIACGFVGVIILVGPLGSDKVVLPMASVIAGLAAAMSYVIAAYYTKKHLVNVSPMAYVTGSQLGAAAVLVPLLPFFIPQETPSFVIASSVVALAVICTSLAFAIYFYILQKTGPTTAMSVAYLIPLFAVIWGSWFLHEAITVTTIAGGILIMGGTALANGILVTSTSRSS